MRARLPSAQLPLTVLPRDDYAIHKIGASVYPARNASSWRETLHRLRETTYGAIITSNDVVASMKPTAVLELLGGSKSFRGKFKTALDLVDLGEKGLTKASLLG